MSRTSKIKISAAACMALILSGCGDQASVSDLRGRLADFRANMLDLQSRLLDRPSGKIDSLFERDILLSNRAFVESKIGPAKYILLDIHHYTVDNCEVLVGYKDDKVQNIGIEGVSRRCQFPLKRFDGSAPEKKLAEMSISDIAASGSSTFIIAHCVAAGCGNAADPSLSVLISRGRSGDFIDVLLDEDYPYKNGDEFLSSIGKIEKLASGHPTNSVSSICFYSRPGSALIKSLSIKTIRLGHGIDNRKPPCDLEL